MRVLRRRVAAMSPREKHLAILSALGLVTLAFYYIPVFLYLTLFVIVCCILWYSHNGELLPARLGLYPRAEFNVPVGLRRWLGGWGVTGVSVAQQNRTKSSKNKNEVREPESNFGERIGVTRVYRRESETESFLFSPRDFLMGSYIGKPESPPAASGRPRVTRNPREQLREKLSRPNHAVYTPNRRLSFAGEPPGVPGRFTITPQRHYPLQQPGISSVGVLPPVKWDGFRKKSILTPRNSPGVLSPVTVKIARPDHHSSPSVDHLSCAGHPKTPVDPCSRESVLKVLKESRKRNVEDDERSFATEQRNKRRRNDSGGSAHSAFEPLLPNGTPSQLVPKPGSLKRGSTSLMEESIMKRSRTSSISSGTGLHAPRGTPGTTRNPIHSSYSSTLGLSQRKKRSAPSPTMSSPESSRSQTPEGASKRSREEEGQSPRSASSVKSDQAASEKTPVTSELTPVSKVPVTTSVDSIFSGGKRKRKIQLVSSHRDDNVSLPPPPELGYTITVKDLDEEKKAAINKIQKILETPAPEPEKSTVTVSPPDTALSQQSSTSSTTTSILSTLLAAPLPTTSTAAIPVINLDPSPVTSVGTAPAASSPLLEVLKIKSSTPISSTSTVSTATVVTPPSLAKPVGLKLNVSSVSPQLTPVSQPQSSSVGVSLPSAFTVLPSQVSAASSTNLTAGKSGLFGLMGQSSTLTPSSSSNPVSAVSFTNSSSSSVSSNPLLASGFKPIFAVTPTATSSTMSTPEIKPSVQTFKPIFGATSAGAGFQSAPISATNPSSTLSSNITSSVFGSISSTTVAPSIFSSMTNTPTGTTSTNSVSTTQNASQPVLKSLFGNWTTPTTASTSSVPVLAPNTGSTFQFGATTTTATPGAATAPTPSAATTNSSNGSFTFGATQPDPQAAKQKVFAFGQMAPSHTSGASFGGFGTASTAVTTAPPTAQPAFSFGKSSFQAPTTQSVFGSSTTQATFGSSASQPPKPFPFGGGSTSSTTASNSAPSPFTFVAAAATTTSSFVTPTKPAFGPSSTGFAFGTSASSATAAAPSFGASSQTQSATSGTFTFGGAPAQQTPSAPAQAASSGFNFAAAVTQFGTPGSNNPAPQMGGFNFAAAATDKPAFGTSTPTFGQSAAQGPIPFGTPGTPVQGFNSVPFGASPTPSFSIGAGSKLSGARQRLQARRQHNRKK